MQSQAPREGTTTQPMVSWDGPLAAELGALTAQQQHSTATAGLQGFRDLPASDSAQIQHSQNTATAQLQLSSWIPHKWNNNLLYLPTMPGSQQTHISHHGSDVKCTGHCTLQSLPHGAPLHRGCSGSWHVSLARVQHVPLASAVSAFPGLWPD